MRAGLALGAALGVVGTVGGVMLTGCALGTLAGGMAESYKRESTHLVHGDYEGLRGKSFAVIVSGDRVLQGAYPTLLSRLGGRITMTLADPALTGATGFVPIVSILEFQLGHPDWNTWTYEQLAEEFGVDALVVVDLYEYRLNEMGNAFLWDGLAAARVGVVEARGAMANEFAYSKEIQVRFPSKAGLGPQDISKGQVQGNLDKRFLDRVTWLFFDHQEPYYPEY